MQEENPLTPASLANEEGVNATQVNTNTIIYTEKRKVEQYWGSTLFVIGATR